MTSAHQEYTNRLETLNARIRKLSRFDLLFSQFRGALFVVFIILLVAAFNDQAAFFWLLAPVLSFVAAAVGHERVIRKRELVRRKAALCERGLARLEDRWAGGGTQGTQYLDSSHSYSEDLDLFGRGSLFELLCIARTSAGESTLAGWLLCPSRPDQILKRQRAIEELRMQLDFREDLASEGSEIRNRMHPETLLKWAEQPAILFGPAVRVAALVTVFLSLLTPAGWALSWWGHNPFVAVVILQILLFRKIGKRAHSITGGAEGAHPELKLLSVMLERIEKQNFQSEYLLDLQSTLKSDLIQPSVQIKRLGRLIEFLDWQRNQLFAPIAILLLWEIQIAFALEKWRRHCGTRIRSWIGVVGEMEALSSLSCYAYEHPDDPFPEITEESPRFEAVRLGHPLIPENRSVHNDIQINSTVRMKIVSGSNMSGKSTLLRTIGVNSVLALCGAPVRAESLRISPLSIGASIHILDSLQSGSSRFYAEITRLRQIMDLALEKPPLLFLLDEILHGTNSADRLIGAEAIVRGFLDRGAIGLVTTHDLALTRIADQPGSSMENIHFQDHIEDGRIAFDYRVHTGVVQKSNAIALMRAVGLDV